MRKVFSASFVFLLLPLAGTVFASQMVVDIRATKEDLPVAGKMTLEETPDGLKVIAEIHGVTPGKHGFHFHENGDCSDEGNAAGGHFNPDGTAHGHALKHDAPAHAGDLGNLEVGPDGTGRYEAVLPKLTLAEGKYSVTNRSIILHEKEDDFGQPTGNAGGRIACGVIKAAE